MKEGKIFPKAMDRDSGVPEQLGKGAVRGSKTKSAITDANPAKMKTRGASDLPNFTKKAGPHGHVKY